MIRKRKRMIVAPTLDSEGRPSHCDKCGAGRDMSQWVDPITRATYDGGSIEHTPGCVVIVRREYDRTLGIAHLTRVSSSKGD